MGTACIVGGGVGPNVTQVVFTVVSFQLSCEVGPAEREVNLHVHFAPAQYVPVYKHLSQMHQHFRVGSCRATKTELHSTGAVRDLSF